MSRDEHRHATGPSTPISRRDLLRRAGALGAGAWGVALAACKSRPAQEIVDLSTTPQVLQAGGTITGSLSGLLTGVAAAGVTIRVAGFEPVQTDATGAFEVRIPDSGEYEIRFEGADFYLRVARLRITGNVSLNQALLERDAGLPMNFLNQFARAAGPNDKEGIQPRTPGATNRWLRPPRIVIHRRLADDSKDAIPEARLIAMQNAIAGLFGPLTGNRLGFPSVQVRADAPPAGLGAVPAGTIVLAQRRDRLLGAEHAGSLTNRYEIAKAYAFCGVESPIELFNRVFAHTLGAYVVSNAFASVANPQGRAAASELDTLAATFLYARAPGNLAPDRDADGVLLNG